MWGHQPYESLQHSSHPSTKLVLRDSISLFPLHKNLQWLPNNHQKIQIAQFISQNIHTMVLTYLPKYTLLSISHPILSHCILSKLARWWWCYKNICLFSFLTVNTNKLLCMRYWRGHRASSVHGIVAEAREIHTDYRVLWRRRDSPATLWRGQLLDPCLALP